MGVTAPSTLPVVSNTLKRRLQRQRFEDRVLVQITKANRRLQLHHGSTGMYNNRWNRRSQSTVPYYQQGQEEWNYVGRGRKSKWGQQQDDARWWEQASRLNQRIEQACAKAAAQAVQITLEGMGDGKGKGKGASTGKGDKPEKEGGWACTSCQLWHTNPTCVKCRKCGTEHTPPAQPPATGGQGGGKGGNGKGAHAKGKGKGNTAPAADADAPMADQATTSQGQQADAAAAEVPLNPMQSPQAMIDLLDQQWNIPEAFDDDDELPPLDWEVETPPTAEQLKENDEIKAMISQVELRPDTPLRQKILQELVTQLLPTKPIDYFALPVKEQSDKQLKLVHYEAEWTKRFAERKVKADKAVEEAQKRLTAAQGNMDKMLAERQKRYEEETTVKTRMAAVRAHFFKEEPPTAEGFATPARLAAKVSPQQVQLLTTHTIGRCDPDAAEFQALGVTGEQVKTLYLAFAKEMIAEQERLHSGAQRQ